jgi:hypothetical protein
MPDESRGVLSAEAVRREKGRILSSGFDIALRLLPARLFQLT